MIRCEVAGGLQCITRFRIYVRNLLNHASRLPHARAVCIIGVRLLRELLLRRRPATAAPVPKPRV